MLKILLTGNGSVANMFKFDILIHCCPVKLNRKSYNARYISSASGGLHYSGVVSYSTNIKPLTGLSRRLFATANSVGRKQIKVSKKSRRDEIFF